MPFDSLIEQRLSSGQIKIRTLFYGGTNRKAMKYICEGMASLNQTNKENVGSEKNSNGILKCYIS